MTINKILEFADGHFELDITFNNGVNKITAIGPRGVKTKKQHITDELQIIKNRDEVASNDITAATGAITLT